MAVAEPALRRRPDGGPSARALVFTLLGEYVRWAGADTVPLRAVVSALGSLGVAEGATRRAVTRLVHEGWLAAEPVGRRTRLRLTPRMVRLLRRWTERLVRAVEKTPWDGEWQMLLLRPVEQAPQHGWLAERLEFEGFGPLGRGVWIAADPGGVDAVRELLGDLGLLGHATFLTSRIRSAEEERSLIAQAWDLAAIRPLFTGFIDRFAGVEPGTDEEAFVARLRMVHAWRLVFDRDPRLPVVFLPDDWPGEEATRLFIDNWLSWYEPADRWWTRLNADA